MRIEILGGAIRDLRDGVRFYDDQAKGVGRYFFDSLSADIDSLQLYAGIHVKDSGFYRMSAKRFPAAIFYRIEGDVVRIHAVIDCRRDPKWIRRRLTRES
jgi:hypothetical protein